jgi:hypothetical protein
MGISFDDVDLTAHRLKHHSKGIIGTVGDLITNGTLLMLSDGSSPEVPADIAMLYLSQLTVDEEVIIDGKRYTEVWPKLESGPHTGDAYVSFGTVVEANPDPTVNPYKPVNNSAAGDYTIILEDDGSGNLTAKSLVGHVSGNDTQIVINHVTWNGSIFTVFDDQRIFGITGNKDIQKGSVTTDKLADDSVTAGKVNFNYAASDVKSGDALSIKDNTISTAKLQDDAVDEDKINDDAVYSQHIIIADATDPSDPNTGQGIATDHIRDGAITADKIDDIGLMKWVKVDKLYTDFGGSSSLKSTILLPASLGNGLVVHSVITRHTTLFQGSPIVTDPTISVGFLGDETSFSSGFNVGTAAAYDNYQISNAVNSPSLSVGTDVSAYLTRGAGSLDDLISGALRFHLLISRLPDPI